MPYYVFFTWQLVAVTKFIQNISRYYAVIIMKKIFDKVLKKEVTVCKNPLIKQPPTVFSYKL